ncbi:GSCFA domain-containing protein [Legionella gresilensis]|uniref:GSCFA domain-containing protein n=1 Tax=Legionella gresilensis TaxID=91823 RepID=UPI0010419770|nr:GSCFA domain-containing protein [Legionella gresilensis]
MSGSKHLSCPYKTRPNHSYWKNSIAGPKANQVDPVIKPKFKFHKKTKVATAGSCFAQHLSRHIKLLGFNYYVPESAPRIISDEIAQQYNYGVFSCRYGNIYTSKQLVQTFDRAFGNIQFDKYWKEGNQFYDPLRPFVNPNGFASLDELINDRIYHLSKVKEMFENLDIFIFTLGLTESWIDRENDIVYPVCPGCGVGNFNKYKYKFYNESIYDVITNLLNFNRKLLAVNPQAKIILTVSPVPLIATMENKHVLVANTYSKSTLRVAAHEVEKENKHIDYFPSYEIITGNFNKGAYYYDDLRTVRPHGVQHVMNIFTKHYINMQDIQENNGSRFQSSQSAKEEQDIDVVCDEELMMK